LSRQGNPKNAQTLGVNGSINELQAEKYDLEKRSTAEDRMNCMPSWKEPNVLQYVEIYFEKFHPVWPFLHRATFEPSQEPPILLQSVVMMGMWMTGDEKMQRHAVKLASPFITQGNILKANVPCSSCQSDRTSGQP
jgi:hypothetical protein